MKKTFAYILCIGLCFFGAGATFYFLYNNVIIIIPSQKTYQNNALQKKEKRNSPFFFLQNDTWMHDTQEIVWSENSQENCTTLVKNWIVFCENEHCLSKKITLQTCLISQAGTTVFLSFDRSPFSKNDSIKIKTAWCESILKTIKANIPVLENAYFLVQQQPLKDYHLDFTTSWPLTTSSRINNAYKKTTLPQKSGIIMIDPAGNALHTGRIIDDTFERSISLHAAQALQKELEHLLPDMRIIFTRLPGDSTVETSQHASFANKLKADLYISLHFFKEQKTDSSLALYYMLIDPDKDYFYTIDTTLSFVSYQTAHKMSLPISQSICTLFYHNLAHSLPQAKLYKPYGIPCKALAGISAPAFLCELGIKHKDDWKTTVHILAHNIAQLFIS